MGKGGPKPAHHIKLEEILFGVGASPEDGIETNHHDPSLLPRECANYNTNIIETNLSNRDRSVAAEDLFVEEEEKEPLNMCIDDGEGFSRSRLTDHRGLSQNGLCLLDHNLVSNPVDWNVNAHESISGSSENSDTQVCDVDGTKDSKKIHRKLGPIPDRSCEVGVSEDGGNDSGLGVSLRSSSLIHLKTEQTSQSFEIDITAKEEFLNTDTNCDEELGNKRDASRKCPHSDAPVDESSQCSKASLEQSNDFIAQKVSEDKADSLRLSINDVLNAENPLKLTESYDNAMDRSIVVDHETNSGKTTSDEEVKFTEENIIITFEGRAFGIEGDQAGNDGPKRIKFMEEKSDKTYSVTSNSERPLDLDMPLSPSTMCVTMSNSFSLVKTADVRKVKNDITSSQIDPTHAGPEPFVSKTGVGVTCGDQSIKEVHKNPMIIEALRESAQENPLNNVLVSFTDERHVDEDKEIRLNENSYTSHDEDVSKQAIDDSVCMDELSSLYISSANADYNSTVTVEQSEKNVSNRLVSNYLSAPKKITENSKASDEVFESPMIYNFDTVLAKLDAAISSEKLIHSTTAIKSSFSCTELETLPASIEDDFVPSQVDSTSKQEEFQVGKESCTDLRKDLTQAFPIESHFRATELCGDSTTQKLENIEENDLESHTSASKSICINVSVDNSSKESGAKTDVAVLEGRSPTGADIAHWDPSGLTAYVLDCLDSDKTSDSEQAISETKELNRIEKAKSEILVIAPSQNTHIKRTVSESKCNRVVNGVRTSDTNNIAQIGACHLDTNIHFFHKTKVPFGSTVSDIEVHYENNLMSVIENENDVKSEKVWHECSQSHPIVSSSENSLQQIPNSQISLKNLKNVLYMKGQCEAHIVSEKRFKDHMQFPIKNLTHKQHDLLFSCELATKCSVGWDENVQCLSLDKNNGEKIPIACGDEAKVSLNRKEMTQDNDLMKCSEQSLSTQRVHAEGDVVNAQKISSEIERGHSSEYLIEESSGTREVHCDVNVALESNPDDYCQTHTVQIGKTNREMTTGYHDQRALPPDVMSSKPEQRIPPPAAEGKEDVDGVLPISVERLNCGHRISSVTFSEDKNTLTREPDSFMVEGSQLIIPNAALDVGPGVEKVMNSETMSPNINLDVEMPNLEVIEDTNTDSVVKQTSPATVTPTGFNQVAEVHWDATAKKLEKLSLSTDDTSDFCTDQKAIEVKIASLQQYDHDKSQCQNVTSFTVLPIEVRFLNPGTNTMPIFASVNGSVNGSIEVKRLERKAKTVPIFAMVNIQTKATQNQDTMKLKAKQNTTQMAFEQVDNINESVPTTDRIASKLDSFTSSLASVTSIESKRSALKTSQKTSSECMQRPKQRVTFQIEETNAERIPHFNDQRDPISLITECHDYQQRSCDEQHVFETMGEAHLIQKRDLGSGDNAVGTNESEQITEDDINEENQDDDNIDPHHIDGNGLLKLADEISLEIDMMEFVSISNGSEPDKQSLVGDGKVRAENEETITDGVCRSTMSDAEETSLHIISSVESLPRDEDAEAEKDGSECESGTALPHLEKVKERQTSKNFESFENQETPGVKADIDFMTPIPVKSIDEDVDDIDNVIVKCQPPHEENDLTIFSAQNEETEDTLCLSTRNEDIFHKESIKDNFIAKDIEPNTDRCASSPSWGRTALELKAYVEEFKSLSSVDSLQASPKVLRGEKLSDGIDCKIGKKKNHENTSTDSQLPLSVKESIRCDVLEYQSGLMKIDTEVKKPSRVSRNAERERNDVHIRDSSKLMTVDNQEMRGVAENGTICVLSQEHDTVTSSNKRTQETSMMEVWVVPGDDGVDSSLPSQVILVEDSLQGSQNSAVESSSKENTSKLDLSRSLSQISQFDMSKLERSIFSGPSVTTKVINENLQCDNKAFDSNNSITDVSVAASSVRSGERQCLNGSEKFARYDGANPSPGRANLDLDTSDMHITRVTFDLPSMSEKSHCRSRSLPRRRSTSRSISRRMHRSISVSPGRSKLKQRYASPQFTRQITANPKHSIDIEDSPVCVILEESIGKTETSKGISSFGLVKPSARASSLNQMLTDHQKSSSSVKSGIGTVNSGIFFTQQQSVETKSSSEDIDFGIKSTYSSSNESQAEYDDQKTMATTIDSFHSHSEGYAEPSTPIESRTLCPDKHTAIHSFGMCCSNLSESEAIDNSPAISIHESSSVRATDPKALDVSVTRSQSFPKTYYQRRFSSNSDDKLGQHVVSIPKDNDEAWFVYREQFKDFFMSTLSLGCTAKPPKEASDINSINSTETSAFDRPGVSNNDKSFSISASRSMPSIKISNLSEQSISVTQSLPKTYKPLCIKSTSEMNLDQENMSLPQDENEDWFAYRKHYGNFFRSSSVNSIHVNQRYNPEHDDATLCSEVLSTKASSRLHSPIAFTEMMTFNMANDMQGMAPNNIGNETVSPKNCSLGQNLLVEPCMPPSDREADLNGANGKKILNQICLPDLDSNLVISHETHGKCLSFYNVEDALSLNSDNEKAYPNHVSDKVIITPSSNPNSEAIQKSIDKFTPIQDIRVDNAHWFRYRKRWSNLFSEENRNDIQSVYKPYIINNTRYRRAMMKEDFDEPSGKIRTTDISSLNLHSIGSNNNLIPTTESKEMIEECIGDASAVGDSIEKSLSAAAYNKEDSPKRSIQKSKPAVIPSKETVVGVVLQESFHVHPSQEMTDVCDTVSRVHRGAKPPISPAPAKRPRERSLPRVRHTKRSLDNNHILPAQDNAKGPQSPSTDQSFCKAGSTDILERSVSFLGHRLTRLPEIQPEQTFVSSYEVTPLASESCTSETVSQFADVSQTSAAQEMSRSPNSRRAKRLKREPLQLSQRENLAQQQYPELIPTHRTHAKASGFPASEEAGEGDLLDEAVGGFEEASLIDDDNLLFIKGESGMEQQDLPGKQLSPLSRHMYTGSDTNNRIGGGDDAGTLTDAVGGLLNPPLELTNTIPTTDVQIMAAETKFKSATSFLRRAIPRKIKANRNRPREPLLILPKRTPTETWDISITPRQSITQTANPFPEISDSPSVKQPDLITQQRLEDERAERELAKKKLRDALIKQKLHVEHLISYPSRSMRNERENFADTGADIDTKAGGDKTKKRLSKAMSSIVYESSEAVPKSPKSSLKSARRVCGEISKKNSVSSKTRKDAGVPRGYVPKPDSLSSLLPAGTLKKKERPRVSPRRVVAEGHYHQESNVISVVVKPVNIKMDREQLNLKVQVHRKQPKSEAALPYPPKEEKPTEDRHIYRKIKFRRPSPTHLPVLASNIIDVRAINPPFNTTMSPEANRRFQSIYGHRKVL